MRRKKLAANFMEAWARKDRDMLASCLSRSVKCNIIDEDTHIASKEAFLKHASKVFRILKEQNAGIIPVYCKNGNYYELIYTFTLPVAVANGEMINADSEQEAYMEIRKVFFKTHFYFNFNLFKINRITFSNKIIE